MTVATPDLFRLLALRSELGYTERLDRAMNDEPEAVTEAEQLTITRAVQREQSARDRLLWLAARNSITVALDALDTPAFARVSNDVRAIRRIVERLDKRVAA